ncbi:replication initiator [Kitasatospora sp. NPDC093679]|uniref:replication initiator n=1 Tax=Kitasatospora sp. NPDC093679 TaxID=3154983 RepID=UPI003433564B
MGRQHVPPPDPATVDMLTNAIRAAPARAAAIGPELGNGTTTFEFGSQLDVRPIRGTDFDGGTRITERAVAEYITKYATKRAEGPLAFSTSLVAARPASAASSGSPLTLAYVHSAFQSALEHAVREIADSNVLSWLLPVLDALDQARRASEVIDGFGAVADLLETELGSLGLQSFGEPGEPFDALHLAIGLHPLRHRHRSDLYRGRPQRLPRRRLVTTPRRGRCRRAAAEQVRSNVVDRFAAHCCGASLTRVCTLRRPSRSELSNCGRKISTQGTAWPSSNDGPSPAAEDPFRPGNAFINQEAPPDAGSGGASWIFHDSSSASPD